jgi:uncharacterized protein
MPHQCVRCNTFYEDGADEILKGCPCGGKLFFYIKKEKLDKIRDMTLALSDKEKEQIESDVKDIVGEHSEDDLPVVLDMEAVRILKPGKYELDLVHLFKKDPLIYKIGEGKYLIDVIRTFASMKK